MSAAHPPTAPLHPAFDPDVYDRAPTIEEQSIAALEDQIACDIETLRMQQEDREQLAKFIDLLMDVRSEQKIMNARMDRLLQIVAGEI